MKFKQVYSNDEIALKAYWTCEFKKNKYDEDEMERFIKDIGRNTQYPQWLNHMNYYIPVWTDTKLHKMFYGKMV